MKDVTKSLRIEPVDKLQHLTFDFLEFRFFWNSENGKAIFFGNPRLLMPIIAIPYMLTLEIYNFRRKRYFIKLGEQIMALFVLKIRHGSTIVNSLAVSPEYRRLGIGLFILNKVENLCRRMNGEWLELTTLKSNAPAQRLYKKYGFTATAERKWSLILRKRIQT
jgi:GNAT superfamily N-acetyltransferase